MRLSPPYPPASFAAYRFMSTLRASQRRRGSLDGTLPAAGVTPGTASPGADPSGATSTSGAAAGGPDPAAVPATMDIHLSAVGAAIYLLDARSGATSSSASTTTTTSTRPGQGGSAPDVSRLASTASMSGSSQRAKSEGSLLGVAAGAGGAAGGDSSGAELLYMLAVALDLGLDYQLRVSGVTGLTLTGSPLVCMYYATCAAFLLPYWLVMMRCTGRCRQCMQCCCQVAVYVVNPRPTARNNTRWFHAACISLS
jgi:hypothetical protein